MAVTIRMNVVILVVSLVAGAPGELNDVCDNFTCSSSAAVCDLLTSTCRLKVGSDCTSNKESCVVGATCEFGTCTCPEPEATVFRGFCAGPAKKLGGTCSPAAGEGACDDVNAECQGDREVGVCVCRYGARPDVNGTCLPEDAVPKGSTNGPCQSDGQCNNQGDLCDTGRCRIRLGEDCSAYSAACSTGATCVSGICTCLPPRAPVQDACYNATGVDTTNIIGTCNPTDEDTCGDPHARCIGTDTQFCVCYPGYSGSVGGSCVARKRTVSGPCEPAEGRSACSDDRAQCQRAGDSYTCVCDPGFFVTANGTCALVMREVGYVCLVSQGSLACRDPEARCVSSGHDTDHGLCVCRDHFEPSRDGSCKLKPGSTNASCRLGTKCDSIDDICHLARCSTKPGGNCSSSSQCVSDATCHPSTRVCACNHPFEEKNGLCKPPTRYVHGLCKLKDSQPCVDPNADCQGAMDTGTCLCRTGYLATTTLTCEPPARAVNGSCELTNDNSCFDENAVCTQLAENKAICLCKADFAHTSDDRCLPKAEVGGTFQACHVFSRCDQTNDVCHMHRCRIQAGRDCSQNIDACVGGASCVSGTCSCQSPFEPINGQCYRLLRSLGGTCNPGEGTDACEDKLAECKAGGGDLGFCICKDNEMATPTGHCSTSAATLNLVSWLLLAVVILTSFFP